MTKPKDINLTNNPRAYRARCEARELEVVEESIAEFTLGVYELANKHGIADVMMVLQANVLMRSDPVSDESPDERVASQCLHLGNEAYAVELASYANGFFRAQLEQRLGALKAHAEKRART